MSDDEVWEDDDHQSKSSVIDDCDISESEDITTLNYNGGSRVEILVTWIIAFLAALQRKHLIPDSAIGALLKFLGTIFKVSTLNIVPRNLVHYLPRLLNCQELSLHDAEVCCCQER